MVEKKKSIPECLLRTIQEPVFWVNCNHHQVQTIKKNFNSFLFTFKSSFITSRNGCEDETGKKMSVCAIESKPDRRWIKKKCFIMTARGEILLGNDWKYFFFVRITQLCVHIYLQEKAAQRKLFCLSNAKLWTFRRFLCEGFKSTVDVIEMVGEIRAAGQWIDEWAWCATWLQCDFDWRELDGIECKLLALKELKVNIFNGNLE